MSLDEQLNELLVQLGVELEEPTDEQARTRRNRAEPHAQHDTGAFSALQHMANHQYETQPETQPTDRQDATTEELRASIEAMADVSLFQTSREHYGVFYRLDLVEGTPQLRIFLPDEDGALKMRCYFVRAATQTPLHEWFVTSHAHRGSRAYDDARESAHQHLLFAAGELMKKLFWAGDLEQMRFPDEIQVVRLA